MDLTDLRYDASPQKESRYLELLPTGLKRPGTFS